MKDAGNNEPCKWVRFSKYRAEDERAQEMRMRQAGVTGQQVSRKVVEMVGRLHDEGYQGLCLDARMAPGGMFWRYQIGAFVDGR